MRRIISVYADTALKSITHGMMVCVVEANDTTIKNIKNAKSNPSAIDILGLFEDLSRSFISNQSSDGLRKSIKMLVKICPKAIIIDAKVVRMLYIIGILVKKEVKIAVKISEEKVKIKLKTIFAYTCILGLVGAILVM